jgi:dipeptidase E
MQLFLTSSANEVTKDIAGKLPKKPSEYNVAFINTAAEVEEGDLWWLRADKKFSITNLSPSQIEEKLIDKNLIFVSGGNTFYLLDQAIKTGFDKILKQKINDNIIYIGSSAGSMLVGLGLNIVRKIDDPNKAPNLKSDGLKIVDFVVLPHWGSKEFKKGYQDSFETLYSENYKIIPLTNFQYLWVRNDDLQIVQI